MSWVVEEWKEGLPTKTLQKIQELESQLDKLKKERQQRQFQLESMEDAFQKQKQKAESEKNEVAAIKRENQSLIETCDNQEKAKQKITHEFQVKESQVNFLEGQLSASKKQIEKLEQELKRYKNDLEKSQLSFNACDMSVCVTPQKSFVAPYTPNKYNDSRYEELQEKYQKEVEERKRLETELKVLRNVPQPTQASSQNNITHRDIARHQASSSVFSWQEDRTPSRSSSSSHNKTLKRSFASSHLPWEEETPSKRGIRSENLGINTSDPYSSQLNDQLKAQNQELKSRINELEMRLQVQEKDLKNQLNKLQETQALYEKSQRELSERDKTLAKCKDDLARVTAQCEQTANKCATAEQKLKKVSDELSCQRQNTESARIALEHKLKEREKENQQEILQQQSSLKNMEQQLSQMKAKMSQEAQQAKNDFNALQSELDRDSKSEKNAMKNQYDQKSKESLKLEEEFQIANQTLRQNQLFVDEMKAKNLHLEAELKSAIEKLQGQDSAAFLNLKATVHNLEMERNFAQELLKKRENDFEEMKSNLARMMEETNAIKSHLDHKEKECKELINTNISLNSWKGEQENVVSEITREKDALLKKIQELEHLLQTHNDQVHLLENDKKNLHTQIKTLQDIVDAKTVDLQNQQLACNGLKQNLDHENQKFTGETEKFQLRISELEKAVEEQNSSACSDKSSYFENLLLHEKQLNCEMQKQMKELLKEKEELQKCLTEAGELHEQFVAGSRNHVESLQENISSKQNYVESIECAIREKEEQITILTEKSGVQDANLQSAWEKNKALDDKLQELSLLSESWPSERERLNSQISLNEKEIERLTEENRRANQVNDSLKDEKTNKELVHQLEAETSESSEEDRFEPRGLPDGAGIENLNEFEALQQELVHAKEKHCRLQREIDRLTNSNEELVKLLDDLRNNEQSLDNITDLSAYLKERENSLNNSHFVLETLPMDLDDDDKQIYKGRTDTASLQETTNTLKWNNDLHLEQEDTFLCDMDPAEHATNISNLLVNISDNQTSRLHASQCDDSICLNKDLLGLQISGDGATTTAAQTIGDNESSGVFTSLNESMSKHVDETLENVMKSSVPQSQSSSPSPLNSNTRKVHETNRKSITGESAADSILGKSLEDQLWMMTVMANGDAGDLKEFLTIYQTEIDELKAQHLLEMEACKQKMKEEAAELEIKLAAEKQQTEYLSHELEVARLELQCLDLSARSFLSFDTEDLSKTLEVANQSICTVLPIGKLSLSSSELLTNHNLKNLIQSLDSTNSEAKRDESVLATSCLDITKEGDENALSLEENTKYSADSTSSNISDTPASKLSLQGIMETLKMQMHQATAENLKLKQSVEAAEEKNQSLYAEIESLNSQIEQQKTELVGKENMGSGLQGRVKELEDERLQLSQEKLQLASRVGDLEKELGNISNATEMLKGQLSHVSGIREDLEISNGNLKEKYLETENELRRVKSERANIESHALSLESDLEEIHAKCQHLQEESEEYRRSVATLQDRLSVVVAEKNQLDQELGNLTEEKDELEEMYQKLKKKVEDLELNKVHNRDLIKILETELRTLKAELQTAKASMEQLSTEKDHLTDLQESEKNGQVETEGLKNQVQQIEEEYRLLLKDSEDMQAQMSKVCNEKDAISKVLESCQYEKRELATNLSSAQEEVAQMRAGIEKLKVRIESDEKKKNHLIGKLKETERNSDHLKDKIENLERELQMSEENLESAILQSESSKEDAEKLNSMKEMLEANLSTFRRRVVDLERELEKSKERIEELESRVLTLSNSLEKSEREKNCLNEESGQELLLLRTQLNEFQEQKLLSEEKFEISSAKQLDLEALLEQNKLQLMQQMEDAQNTSRTLEFTIEKVTLELRECKEQLDEKTMLVLSLQGKLEEAENLEKMLAELAEQKALSEEKYNAAATENAELLTLMDQNKAGLLQQVEEAQGLSRNLERSLQKIATELDETKGKLQDKEQQMSTLECKLEEMDESEKKCRAELLQYEAERDCLKGEIENQQRDLNQLQAKVQVESEASESSEAAIRHLKSTCTDLEAQLQSSDAEKQLLLQKVDELTEDCDLLQSKLHEAEMEIKTLHEQLSLEKKVLDEQLQTNQQQIEGTNTRLRSATVENTELKETIDKLRIELEAQAEKSRSDAGGFQNRLLQSESKQQEALDTLLIQHKEEIQTYQSKLALAEEHINGHGREVQRLNAANVELTDSLSSAHRQLEELNQLKVSFAELKEEHAGACTSLKHWMESCTELELEKDRLLGKIKEREEQFRNLQPKQQNAEGGSNEDLLTEIEELKQWLEEKTLEADESVEKYCTLMIKSHKLEEDNDTLKKQLDFLSSKLKQLETSKEVPPPPHGSDHPPPQSMDRPGGNHCKRRREQDVTLDKDEPQSPTPQGLPKRVRKSVSRTVPHPRSTEEERDFQPDGLPEVVQKGFADIPSGKQSPFILRRTAAAAPVRKSPRLAALKPSPSSHISENLDNPVNFSSPAAGGSKAQQSKFSEAGRTGSEFGPMEVSSPLSAYNRLHNPGADSLMNRKLTIERISEKLLHDESETEEACHVQ
ncbi:centromere protein F isoform X2 [Xenopus laevis]|uniref:Centromere protein F isoform X2 n=1 Tax=Xenopus laevis TaxID=8355 RepID=A0A8J0V9F2_XENLA|nr:centromere protein F isoform X2 [Xenopus laevis]